MKHNLKISVSKTPQSGGIVSCRNVTIRERFLRFLLGDKQKLTILVPGDTVQIPLTLQNQCITTLSLTSEAKRTF